MNKTVVYKFLWNGSTRNQPYQTVAQHGATFQGGMPTRANTEFKMGIVTADDELTINQAIAACSDFEMSEITPDKVDLVKHVYLQKILDDELAEQNAGFTCSNNIKLQIRDADLLNWTQLMAGIMAFSPATVSVRDFDNVTHSLPTAQVSQMLAEVFVFGQTLYAKTWAAKDALNAATTFAEVEAVSR